MLCVCEHRQRFAWGCGVEYSWLQGLWVCINSFCVYLIGACVNREQCVSVCSSSVCTAVCGCVQAESLSVMS